MFTEYNAKFQTYIIYRTIIAYVGNFLPPILSIAPHWTISVYGVQFNSFYASTRSIYTYCSWSVGWLVGLQNFFEKVCNTKKGLS